MLRLDKDVFTLILEVLQDDGNSLCSCLLVNKNWSELVIPILWKNPWKCLKNNKKKILFDVIISHLSDEIKDILSYQNINQLSIVEQEPLFNYISFCKYLKLDELENIILTTLNDIERFKFDLIINEILKLFINENTRLTYLYIPFKLQHQIQIHLIPGAKYCFSKLEFLECSNNYSQEILEGLAGLTKSIKKLDLGIALLGNNSGAIKLIQTQQSLNDVCLYTGNAADCKALEESLIQRADTIRYMKICSEPVTNFLSYLVNLKSLELITLHESNWADVFTLNEIYELHRSNWSRLENISLPVLKILKTQLVPSKILATLIENTNGSLTEICIDKEGMNEKRRLIQAIYQNCPDLRYLKLSFDENNTSELENILINCQHLDGLVIRADEWENILEILAKSSPPTLFKFKFFLNFREHQLELLKVFFDNWKGRSPMLLQIFPRNIGSTTMYFDFIKNHKLEGIVKKYNINSPNTFEDFEWIKPKLFSEVGIFTSLI